MGQKSCFGALVRVLRTVRGAISRCGKADPRGKRPNQRRDQAEVEERPVDGLQIDGVGAVGVLGRRDAEVGPAVGAPHLGRGHAAGVVET